MENEPQPFEFKEGTLWVAVHSADVKTTGPYSDRIVECTPALSIGSDKQMRYRSETTAGVKIRGRLYRVNTGRKPAHRHTTLSGRVRVWSDCNSYNQYLNDNNLPVSWDTATARRLDAMVDEASSQFAAMFPDWRDVSVRMAIEAQRSRVEGKIAALNEELEKLTEKRVRFDAVLASDPVRVKDIRWQDIDA